MTKSCSTSSTQSEVTAEIINRIPGGEHLRTVQDALKNGHASVMIGAGFSLNAQGGQRLPTWAKLIDSLLADLYSTDEARNSAKKRLGGTSGMLRLAEEYAAVRGRAQLDARLHELLPDAGAVTPGDLHTKLLSLYWNDVFTTNYDTLLERSLDADRTRFIPVIKSRYQIVAAADDVPLSRRNGRPRIVKLHGTLRSGTKLIVTEEDYRRYPTDFAPLVNTVQQSMLENVFCLIGFSGDDPNFLLWTGWARDHLGDKAPPIYLITLSPIPLGQRIILERRKIFPIDIAELGMQNGRVDYGKALNAVLDYWQEMPPLRRADWPYHNAGSELKGIDPTVTELVEWQRVAQRNRQDYPGWLVAPASNRERLYNASSVGRVSIAIKKSSPLMPQWLRLVLLREIAWIHETTLSRLSNPIVELIVEDFAHTVRCTATPTAALPDAVTTAQPTLEELEHTRVRLALEMLRHAREGSDSTRFANWLLELKRLSAVPLSAELRCSMLHEQILFHLEQRDKQSAINLLGDLELVVKQDVDPYWPIRLGALFGEVGVVRRAYGIVEDGLLAIRQAIQFEGETAALLSREQWAEWLFGALRYAVEVADEPPFGSTPRHRRSGSWSPEPGLKARISEEEEKSAKTSKREVIRDQNARDNVEHPNFLMDEVRYEIDIAEEALDLSAIELDSTSIPTGKYAQVVRREGTSAAIAYVRLVERASLPPSVGMVSFTAQSLLACYRILARDNATANLRVFSRASSREDSSSGSALDLPTIASLDADVARQLFQQAIGIVRSITVNTRWDDGDASTVKFLLDIASRVAFRLEPSDAVALCEAAVQLYSVPAIRDDYSFHDVFAKFFERAVRLLPDTEINRLGPQLLSLSPKGIRYLERRTWPDVVHSIGTPTKLKPSDQWEAAAARALDEMEELASAEQRHELADCVKRLDWFYRTGLMTSAQKKRFSLLIWRNVGPNDIPKFENFYAAAFVKWPLPSKTSTVKEKFVQWVSNENISPIEKMADFMGEQRLAIGSPNEGFLIGLLLSVSKGVDLKWTEPELIKEINKLRDWSQAEGRRLVLRATTESNWDSGRDLVGARLRLIANVVHRVFSERLSIEAVRKSKLDEWFKELWDAGVAVGSPLSPLLFACLRWWPTRTAAVLDITISTIELNPNRYVVVSALNAASVWVKESVRPTPDTRRYIAYLVDGICSGPEPLIEHKLDAIFDMLEYVDSMHFQEHRSSLTASLYALLNGLQYRTRNETAKFNLHAIPLLRVAAVRVLVAMGRHIEGCASEPSWVAAMELARNDPLLIVRQLTL